MNKGPWINSLQLKIAVEAIEFFQFYLKQEEEYANFMVEIEKDYLYFNEEAESEHKKYLDYLEDEKEKRDIENYKSENRLSISEVMDQEEKEFSDRLEYQDYLEDPQYGDLDFDEWKAVERTLDESSKKERRRSIKKKEIDKVSNSFNTFSLPTESEINKMIRNNIDELSYCKESNVYNRRDLDFYTSYRKHYQERILKSVEEFKVKQITERKRKLLEIKNKINENALDCHEITSDCTAIPTSAYIISNHLIEPIKKSSEALLALIFNKAIESYSLNSDIQNKNSSSDDPPF